MLNYFKKIYIFSLPSKEPFLNADVALKTPFSFWIFAIVSALKTTSMSPTLHSVEIQL